MGQQHRSAASLFSPPVTSLNATINATFPQFSETGIWRVQSVRLADALDNVRIYDTTELAQLGFPTELVVVGQAEDVTPPAIKVSATPKDPVAAERQDGLVTISGMITDAESGVNASTAAYAVIDEYGLIQPNGHIQVAMNGSYSFTIQLQASRKGNDRDGRQYTITISAQNNEGNQGSKSTVVTVPHDQRRR